MTPSYNPTTHGRATHSSNACRPGTPAEKASTYPAHATDTQGVEASVSSPWCRTRIKPQRPPPTSPGRGPHFPDPRDPPATEKGAAPHPDPSSHLTLLSRVTDPRGAGQRSQPNTRGPLPGRRPRECYRAPQSARSGRWRWAHDCSPPSALRQRPRRHMRPLCTKSSVPSAAPLCGAWETPQGPEPHPATGPTATAHSRTRATRVPHRPCAREETTRQLRDCLLPPEGRTMDVARTAAHSAINHDDPGRASLAQKDPSYNLTTRGRATHPSNACRSETPTGKMSTCPTHAKDTRRVEASLSSPWCRTRTKTQRLPPTSPWRGPRFPDPRNPPATEKGAAPHPDPSFHLNRLSRELDPHGAGQRARPNTRDPRPGR